MKEIFYYDELKFDDLNIDVDFIIKLDDNNKEIIIDNITYEYEYKYERNKKYKKQYNLNLKLNLGALYYIIDLYYNIINKYKIPINRFLSTNLVLFGYDYINYFLNICENQEKEFFKAKNKRINIFKHQLNKICDILNYHIYKGMNELKIYENNKFDNNKYNEWMINLKKYQDLVNK